MPVQDRGSAYIAELFGIPQGKSGSLNMANYRGKSLNQPYNFRQILREDKFLVGTCIGIASLPIARISATLGFDFIFVDGEHTPMSPDFLSDIIKTINYSSEGDTGVIVRLPTFGHEWIAWALDAGASGIVLPHSETVEQIEKVIQAARFAPVGHRSYPPFATIPGHTDGVAAGQTTMLDVWNDFAAIIPQIESKKGADNAEAICALKEVDAIMIGTGDLRLDLGLPPGLHGEEPIFTETMNKIFAAAKKHNKVIFGFAQGPALDLKIAQGFKGLMVSADAFALVGGQTATLIQAREKVAAAEKAEGKKVSNGVKA